MTTFALLVSQASIAWAQPFEISNSWLEGFDDWASEIGNMKAEDFQFSLGVGVGITPDLCRWQKI
ncbi:MAG: hypothetical protein CK529_01815 [Rhodospirillaceae bacterium]|nr:MAG: hypothetical protein CK529_01815 [Rhodospirillaceae bacterium]